MLQGISLRLAAFRVDAADEQRGLAMVIGGVMVVIGVVFIVWTDVGVIAISWLVGIGAAVIGTLLIYLTIKRLRARIESNGECRLDTTGRRFAAFSGGR